MAARQGTPVTAPLYESNTIGSLQDVKRKRLDVKRKRLHHQVSCAVQRGG